VGIRETSVEGLEVTTSATVDAAFWKGRRVFVTGHTGFKGSWLALWLSRLGAKVTGYALAPETPSLFDQAHVGTRIDSKIADVRDRARLSDVMREAEPEIVLHLAAQPLVRPSYETPLDTFEVNVMGTANVLEAARHVPSVGTAVIVTTDKCYENREWLWGYRETDALGGHDPYSSSKACAELVTSAYRRSFFHDGHRGIATVRAGNVIGGGDWAVDRIVPDLVRAAMKASPLHVRNPASTRPWQHVLDVLAGYLMLAERLYRDPVAHSEAWNFGPDPSNVRSVSELATLACTRWGDGASWEHVSKEQVHEARSLTLDSTRARLRLGWTPRLAFEASVTWSMEWYRECHNKGDLMEITLRQLEQFERLP